ncbi:MAG: carbon starvation protein A [Verrucomicrobiales bacterium]|nr:carbon starvation protein A [Verrucomicrobiales bacterium]
METLLIALLAGLGFIVAYHTYGRWLGKKIFRLSASAVCPSEKLEDGVDYVPTSKSVVFGHHFTSIAGTGPIVGPAIAIMWGWVPALLWVVLGSIFIGAVHDFGALVVSLRNNGQTVGEIAGRVLNKRVRLLFLFVLFMALTVVLAIFGLVIAAVFKQYPAAIFPCVVQIPIAIIIGTLLHRKGFGLFLPSLIALAVMYLTVIYGNTGALGAFNAALAAWPLWQWVLVLLGYSYVASVLPVWTLLQPRDYINSLQLISALVLIVVGLGVAAFFGYTPSGGEKQTLSMVAPMWDFSPKNAPLIFPFLFITIACGAVSGFHCLVSSGTSSKQLKNEEDARFVGYGSMLTEGFLATLVILACGAGLGLGMMHEGTMLTGTAAWTAQYGDWLAAGALAAKVGAFVQGSANFLQALGIAPAVAIALMGVLVASFAGTTLDTACRLQRYVVQELAATLGGKVGESNARQGAPFAPLAWLQNKHGATIFAIVIAAAMAAVPPAGKAWSLASAGKGGLLLWPLFGATNQLLAGLSFLVITFYLWRRGRAIWFLAIPMIFMLIMPVWAMTYQLWEAPGWLLTAREGFPDHKPNYLLGGIGLATIALEIWMIVEAVKIFPKAKGVLEENALDQPPESAPAKA